MAAFNFKRTGVLGPLNFGTFGCNVFKLSPPTPDRIAPEQRLHRQMHSKGFRQMWDGRGVQFWSFEDPESDERNSFPGPTMRMEQGKIVHSRLSTRHGSHTIHHHGLEPTTMNDGVGHVSFEATDHYVYQIQPTVAGTFLYHCHKNTVLHFEMGMYGFLVVDPPPVALPPGVPPGSKQAFAGGPWYQAEALWAYDDVDPDWHTRLVDEFDAGLCGDDVGLNDFRPKYFLTSGLPYDTRRNTNAAEVRVKRGESVLLRLLNGGYSVLRVTLPDSLSARCIAIDGRPLGGPDNPWSRPFTIGPDQPFVISTAGRFDLLVKAPATTGRHRVRIDFLNWITHKVHNRGTTYEGSMHSEVVVV